jgi:hypothetical protein
MLSIRAVTEASPAHLMLAKRLIQVHQIMTPKRKRSTSLSPSPREKRSLRSTGLPVPALTPARNRGVSRLSIDTATSIEEVGEKGEKGRQGAGDRKGWQDRK